MPFTESLCAEACAAISPSHRATKRISGHGRVTAGHRFYGRTVSGVGGAAAGERSGAAA